MIIYVIFNSDTQFWFGQLQSINSFQFQFGSFNFPDAMRQFVSNYRCYSVSMLPGNERHDVENGGKSKITKKFQTFNSFHIKFHIFSYHATIRSGSANSTQY